MITLLALLTAATPKPIAPDVVRSTARDFAICATRRHPDRAARFVLDPHNFRKDKWAFRLYDPICLTDRRSFRALAGKSEQFRYLFAEALVLREYPSDLPMNLVNAAPLTHVQPVEDELKPNKKDDPARLAESTSANAKMRAGNEFISMLGECVVRANPVASHGLLLTAPGSLVEGQYLERLSPVAAACIEKGAGISLTKYSLRGTIALNFYRLAKAPRATYSSLHNEWLKTTICRSFYV